MAQGEKTTTIEVSAEIARLVNIAMQAGSYASPSELIGDALRSWHGGRDDLAGFTPGEMNGLIDEGVASGPGQPVDFAEIKLEVRRRAEAIGREA